MESDNTEDLMEYHMAYQDAEILFCNEMLNLNPMFKANKYLNRLKQAFGVVLAYSDDIQVLGAPRIETCLIFAEPFPYHPSGTMSQHFENGEVVYTKEGACVGYNYNQADSKTTLLRYGFVSTENYNDTVQVHVVLSDEDEFADEKLDILLENNLK